MSEFDPMEELGLIHDKQLVCSCQGFLVRNNSTREICERFIKDGGKFYDLISRYDDMIAYVLNRDEGRSGNVMRFITPFLKAFGATDYAIYEFCKENLKLMPNSDKVMRYLVSLLPTFVTTSMYEHSVMPMCDMLDIPLGAVDCTKIELDDFDFSRKESRTLREYAGMITSLKMPRNQYELNVPTELSCEDIEMIRVMDEIFHDNMSDMECNNMMRDMRVVGANEKAYSLLDVRKRTQIDLDGTAYIGGDMQDYQTMDLIRDSGGLSLSFNGSEFGVHGCNIAVLSRDCTAAAVLVQEFYNEGIEAVFDLVGNWNRESLKKRDCPDRHLMNSMLNANPRKLPEAYIVDRNNADAIAAKSDAYRKKLMSQKYS